MAITHIQCFVVDVVQYTLKGLGFSTELLVVSSRNNSTKLRCRMRQEIDHVIALKLPTSAHSSAKQPCENSW
jgi:hypothetical protein